MGAELIPLVYLVSVQVFRPDARAYEPPFGIDFLIASIFIVDLWHVVCVSFVVGLPSSVVAVS